MPDPVTHANITAPTIGSAIAAAVGAIFHVDLIAIGAAIVGAWFGLVFRPEPPAANSRLEMWMRFVGNTGYVLGTTVTTAFSLQWLVQYQPGAEYSLAFFASMLLMIFREKIINGAGKTLDVFFSKIGGDGK